MHACNLQERLCINFFAMMQKSFATVSSKDKPELKLPPVKEIAPGKSERFLWSSRPVWSSEVAVAGLARHVTSETPI